MKRRTPPTFVLAALVGVLLLALTGCGASKTSKESPAKRLAAAKAKIDKSPALHIKLDAGKLPDSVTGVISADGTGTHQPGFEGDVRVVDSGLPVTVPMVAVGGKVYIKFGGWQDVDPADYNAPDPAGLMSPDNGLSTLLTKATKLRAGKEKRSGKQRVTSIDATVPGQVVAQIIPSADSAGSFNATFTLDDKDQLTKAVLAGKFYPDAGKVTYTFEFSDYGSTKTVKAP